MKHELIVKVSCIIIKNYYQGDCLAIEKMFRIWVPQTFSYKIIGMDYDETTHTLYLSRHVDIAYLESLLGVKARFDEKYNKPNHFIHPLRLKYPPRNEKQKKAMNFLVGGEGYDYTSRSNQLYLGLDTGMGKTYLAIFYSGYVSTTTLVVCSAVSWLGQWADAYMEHSNILSSEMMNLGGSGMSIDTIMSKSKEELSGIKVYFMTYASLCSYANKHGWNNLNKLFIHLGIGLKIIDEGHLDFRALSLLDLYTSIHKTIYMSATPARSGEEARIYKNYFKNIYILSLHGEEDNHTHYVGILYHSGVTSREKISMYSNYGFNKCNYANIVSTKDNMYKILRIILDSVQNMYGRKLIYVATNEAIMRVYNWLQENYPEYRNNVGIFTSANKDKAQALLHNVILTTVKSAGPLLDIPYLIAIINLAEPIDTFIQNKQKMGRLRAYGTYYFDIVDIDSDRPYNYYSANLGSFAKYALSMKEVYYNNDNLDRISTGILNKRNMSVPLSSKIVRE